MSTETKDGRTKGPGSRMIDTRVERIGLLSLHHPAIMSALAVIVLAVALLGLTRLEVDDSLSQLFRSDSREYRQYEEASKRFPSSEYHVLVVVSGPILERSSIEALRGLATDLQLVEGVRGLADAAREFVAVHLRHHHVGDEDVDG